MDGTDLDSKAEGIQISFPPCFLPFLLFPFFPLLSTTFFVGVKDVNYSLYTLLYFTMYDTTPIILYFHSSLCISRHEGKMKKPIAVISFHPRGKKRKRGRRSLNPCSLRKGTTTNYNKNYNQTHNHNHNQWSGKGMKAMERPWHLLIRHEHSKNRASLERPV